MSERTSEQPGSPAVLVGVYGDADAFLADLRANGVIIPETRTAEPAGSNRPTYGLPTPRRDH